MSSVVSSSLLHVSSQNRELFKEVVKVLGLVVVHPHEKIPLISCISWCLVLQQSIVYRGDYRSQGSTPFLCPYMGEIQ